MSLEDQVIILFAGVNGYTDKIPVERMKEWETGLFKHVDVSQPEIRKDIQSTHRITKTTEEKLREAIHVYNSTWK
jgi:F-type H+-transporting ATPase subunit alpha